MGIYRIATSLNKKAHIVINDITSSVRPMMERFLNNPDYPDDLFLTGDKACDLVDANTALVVVDVNRPSITEAPELLTLAKTIVVLDHHRPGTRPPGALPPPWPYSRTSLPGTSSALW